MSNTKIMTECQDFRKVLSANYSTNGYPTITATNTEPSGDGVIELGDGVSQNAVILVPYGIGSNNNTFSIRLIGWRKVGNSPASWLWIPVNLAEVQCTLTSTVTGAANTEITASNLFVDAITLVTGNSNVSIDINSTADNTVAHLVADTKGSRKLQPIFTTGGVATSCNALYTLM